MKSLLTLVVVAWTVAFMVQSALAQSGAKAIYYSESGPTVTTQPTSRGRTSVPKKSGSQVANKQQREYMGLTYWIELIGTEGQKKRVTTDYTFRSGDRIKLHVQSNRDGYLYLVNLGSTGRSHMLFPYQGMAQGNTVKANVEYEVPYTEHILFDQSPGEETLLVMLSSTPMGEILQPGDIRPASLSTEDTARLLANVKEKGAKDLILETDTTSTRPASYAVAPLASLKAGGMMTLHVKLKHQ
ncbi:MAG: DUF4384 domain-containing protein [Candidatus Methylomirabilis oxyfera]|nr:DUF4384 domain-containing protein [Candidatus Methylomirabilis oxyfera]